MHSPLKHGRTISLAMIPLIVLEINTFVGQLIGPCILSPGHMSNGPAVKAGEMLPHFFEQNQQGMVLDLVAALDLADDQF